jgi:hypothetical protein
VEVRQTLKETLEWPTKYAHLYKDVPIRMRSGYACPHSTHTPIEIERRQKVSSEPIIIFKSWEG